MQITIQFQTYTMFFAFSLKTCILLNPNNSPWGFAGEGLFVKNVLRGGGLIEGGALFNNEKRTQHKAKLQDYKITKQNMSPATRSKSKLSSNRICSGLIYSKRLTLNRGGV